MAKLPTAEHQDSDPLQELWDVHNEILRRKGNNLSQLLLDWVKKQKERFQDPHSAIEFEELCNDGCVPQVLSVLLSFDYEY